MNPGTCEVRLGLSPLIKLEGYKVPADVSVKLWSDGSDWHGLLLDAGFPCSNYCLIDYNHLCNLHQVG